MELSLRSVVTLTTGSMLRSEADMLRLESIHGGGSVPRPKRNNNRVPYTPEVGFVTSQYSFIQSQTKV